MTDPTEIARVAAGLTRAQREAVEAASDIMSNHGGYAFMTVDVTRDPWPEGVAQFLTLKSDRLTPLGLAVRNHILREKSGG